MLDLIVKIKRTLFILFLDNYLINRYVRKEDYNLVHRLLTIDYLFRFLMKQLEEVRT